MFEDVVPDAVNHPYEQLTFPDYEYFDKTYNGQAVISVEDISHFTGLTRSSVNWSIRTKLTARKDYFFLEHTELSAFKIENPKVDKLTSGINVITKTGFDKLMRIYGIKSDKLKCFETNPALPAPKSAEYIPHKEIISLMGYIDRNTVLINEYRKRLLQSSTMAEAQMNRKELLSAIRELKHFAFDVETILLH